MYLIKAGLYNTMKNPIVDIVILNAFLRSLFLVETYSF